MFQVYNSIIHHLYIILCAHHPKSSLLLSPFIPPLPSPTSPHSLFWVWTFFIFYYCCSVTVVPPFSPVVLPCPAHPHPRSHSQSPPHCLCPWVLYLCFFTWQLFLVLCRAVAFSFSPLIFSTSLTKFLQLCQRCQQHLLSFFHVPLPHCLPPQRVRERQRLRENTCRSMKLIQLVACNFTPTMVDMLLSLLRSLRLPLSYSKLPAAVQFSLHTLLKVFWILTPQGWVRGPALVSS